MEGSRGKRGKKAPWQVSVGLKDVVFAGIGVVGLMMIAFVLGALAGRGDIYRVFYKWGLVGPEAARVAQWLPPAPAPGTPGAGSPVAAPAPATSSGAVPARTAAKAPPQPVTGAIAPAPEGAAAPAAKKGRGAAAAKDQKAREEELRKARQEVVGKLKFQNSLDGQPKAAKAGAKPKEKAGGKTPAAPVKVAQYRDAKAAKAKVAELQKKGIKATLKEGKDDQGALYIVYRPAPGPPQETKAVAQSSEKKRKPAGQ
jgi:hypothetical protein